MNTWHKVVHVQNCSVHFLELPMWKRQQKIGDCVTQHLVESMLLWQIVVWFKSGVNGFDRWVAHWQRLSSRPFHQKFGWLSTMNVFPTVVELNFAELWTNDWPAENVWTPRGWVANPSRLHSNPSSTPCATRPICTQMMARIAQTDRCHWRWLTPYAPGQILPQVRRSSIDEFCMHSLSAVDTLPQSSSQSFATEEMGKVWMMEDERSKKTGEAMLMWRMKQGLEH